MADRNRPEWIHPHSGGLPVIHPAYLPTVEEASSSMPASSSTASFGLATATYTPQIFRPESSYQNDMVSSRNQYAESFSSYHPAFQATLQGQGYLPTSATRQPNFPLHQMVLPGGHQIDNRTDMIDAVVSMHRVMAPSHVDSTVSHQPQDRRQPTHHMVPEVNTTGQMHMEVEVVPLNAHRTAGPPQVDSLESTVSSITGSTQEDMRDSRGRHVQSKLDRTRRPTKDRVVMLGEPDTTQTEEDDYNRAISADKDIYVQNTHTGQQILMKTSSHNSDSGYVVDIQTPSSAVPSNLEYTINIEGSGVTQATSMPDFLISTEPSRSESSSTSTPTSSATQHIGGTSYSIFSSMRRKSNRLNDQDNDNLMWRKASYIAKPYDPNQLWCEDCMTTYESECILHKLVPLPDRVVFSRAWASLPQGLQIFRLGENKGSIELGVFAKRPISKYTQFGPFVADIVDSREKLSCNKFPLMVEREEGEVAYYETSDENKCNWMMFVRTAEKFSEQNLVAYQFGQDIYFTVTRQIDVKQELKVWYAVHYAARVGRQPLRVTEEDLKAIEEQQNKFQCYECPKRFKTAAALQKHLSVHDEGYDDTVKSDSDGEDMSANMSDRAEVKRRRNLISQSIVRKRLQSVKKLKDVISENGSASGGSFHWKKRSTNIYLNKTLRKYQKRHDEAMRRTLRSMYRIKKNDGDEAKDNSDDDADAGSDDDKHIWKCKSCPLTFDNANLLNLHTLTHAAHDVGLDEVRRFTDMPVFPGNEFFNPPDLNNLGVIPSIDTQNGLSAGGLTMTNFTCPVCSISFKNKNDLIQHASGHGKAREAKLLSDPRPHKCDVCWKAFSSIDRLVKHQLCHGDDENKPLQCPVCFKRFMNNSAISCHMKIHSQNKYYQCPICPEGFDQTSAFRKHSLIHVNQDGLFDCPHCDKKFAEFLVLKKHVRGLHTNQSFKCLECDKVFPRMDKLRLHSLKHSTVRECQCEICGRLFKRMDKLREHNKRMHSKEREEKDRIKAMSAKPRKFQPKVPPTEFHRFIYKCTLCMLGFKRRGMLVNHIAKRHPEVTPNSVPELNLPILKTQRDYYCQYCDKVYKSSSKRKTHILKNHPGAELPPSSRKKTCLDDIPGIPNPTYSQTVGSITTMPHQCEYCHKQYASKAKLLQHYRRNHIDKITLTPEEVKQHTAEMAQQLNNQAVKVNSGMTVNDEDDNSGMGHEAASHAQDLLTQAMSELTQSLQEFRAQSVVTTTPNVVDAAILQARIPHQGAPTMVQIHAGNITTPIDLAHISQALQQFTPAQATLQEAVSSSSHEIQISTLNADSSDDVTASIVAQDSSQRPGSPKGEQPSQSHQNWQEYS